MIRRELGEISFHSAAFLDCVQPDFGWFPVFVGQTGNSFGESSSQQTASSTSQAGFCATFPSPVGDSRVHDAADAFHVGVL
jgi:hypothetical protein